MLTPEYLRAWLSAFLFTQVVEIPLWRVSTGASFQRAFLLTLVTHPFVWFAFPALAVVGVPYPVSVTASELFAWGMEAFLVQRFTQCSKKRAMLASLAANGASFILGAISQYFWGWP